MTRHDKIAAPTPERDEDLLRRTEAAFLAFLAENDGKMPTQQHINAIVRTSFTRLGPAFRAVKERLLATQTRLSAMPEIPDELRLAHDQMLKELWARAKTVQDGEISDLRRAQAARDERNQDDLRQLHEIVAQIEAERDETEGRAAAAEKVVAELHERLDTALTELVAATARLAEREAIVALLLPGVAMASADPQEAAQPKPVKTTRRAAQNEEPETLELPMETRQADRTAGPGS